MIVPLKALHPLRSYLNAIWVSALLKAPNHTDLKTLCLNEQAKVTQNVNHFLLGGLWVFHKSQKH